MSHSTFGHHIVVDTIEEPEELGTTVGFQAACLDCGSRGEVFADINDAGDDDLREYKCIDPTTPVPNRNAPATKQDVFDAMTRLYSIPGVNDKDVNCHVYVEDLDGEYVIDLCYGDNVYYGDRYLLRKSPYGSTSPEFGAVADVAALKRVLVPGGYVVVHYSRSVGTITLAGTGYLYEDMLTIIRIATTAYKKLNHDEEECDQCREDV